MSPKIPFSVRQLFEAADAFGTPTYIYNETEIVGRCRRLAAVFPSDLNVRWLYAMKANDNPHLLALVAGEGFGFDTVSSEEMWLGLMFQSPADVFYTENNMTDEEMAEATRAGVVLNVGSVSRLRKFCQANPGGSVSIRIKPDIGDGHHSKVVTGNTDSKFGIPITELEACVAMGREHGVKISGIHVHIGSGIKEPANFYAAMEKLLHISRLFPDLETVNFGGGLPIPYREGEAEFDLSELRRLAEPLLRKEMAFRDGKIGFRFEPGRYIMAQAGGLLTRVNTVKDQGPGARVYLGCDTGFNHLVRPAMYEAWHEIYNLSRLGEPADREYTLAGNICESGDLLAENRRLPETHEGDLIYIADAGAYGMVMASEYNRRRLPAEVLASSDGETKCIRPREGVARVISLHLARCGYPGEAFVQRYSNELNATSNL